MVAETGSFSHCPVIGSGMLRCILFPTVFFTQRFPFRLLYLHIYIFIYTILHLQLTWSIAGVLVMMASFCYAELGSIIPSSGGDYDYLKRAYGDQVAFSFAWFNFFVVSTTVHLEQTKITFNLKKYCSNVTAIVYVALHSSNGRYCSLM